MLLSFIAAAAALTAASPAPAEAPTDTEISETKTVIVVARPAVTQAATATKTDTPLIETPVSIQVITKDTLETQGILTLDRALLNVSGVATGNGQGAQENITLRGFFTTTTFRNGFRIDEYSTTGGGTTGAVSLSNVERIEVLKGPAAILYGRVEPGGLVNVVTKQPLEHWSGAVQQTLGSFNHFVSSADITGPLDRGGRLLFRVNGSWDQSDSYRDNVNSRSWVVAPVVEWRIGAKTSLSVETEIKEDRLQQDVGQLAYYDRATGGLVFPPRTAQILDNPSEFHKKLLEIRLSHEFSPDWSLNLHLVRNSVITLPRVDYYPVQIVPSGPDLLIDRNISSVSDSNRAKAAILDLTGHFSTFGLRHTVLIGGDYYNERFVFDIRTSPFGEVSTTDFLNPTPPSGLAIDPNSALRLFQGNVNWGVHAQDQVRLPADLFLLAGLRLQHFNTTNAFEFPVPSAPIAGQAAANQAVTPRVGLLWRPQKWFSLYSNYSTNFGANNGFDFQGRTLAPERAREYEVGAKTEAFERRLTASLALYHLTKVNVAVADLAHPGFQETIGEIGSKGVEFDVQGQLAPGLSLIANASYNDVRVTRSTPGSNFVEGNRLDNVPHWLGSFYATYAFQQAGLRGWQIGGGVTYRGASLDTQGGIPPVTAPAYPLVSATLGRNFPLAHTNARAQINVNNLLNRRYYDNLFIVASNNYAFLNQGIPREIIASFKVAF